jgi:hypothetical protein
LQQPDLGGGFNQGQASNNKVTAGIRHNQSKLLYMAEMLLTTDSSRSFRITYQALLKIQKQS